MASEDIADIASIAAWNLVQVIKKASPDDAARRSILAKLDPSADDPVNIICELFGCSCRKTVLQIWNGGTVRTLIKLLEGTPDQARMIEFSTKVPSVPPLVRAS